MRSLMILGIAFGLALLTAAGASAQLAEKKVITLAAARKMVAAAEAEAERNHWAGVIAIVDDGGWLILVERMDNAAFTASVELAPGRRGRPPCLRSRAKRSRMPSLTVVSHSSRRVTLSKCREACRSSSMAK